MNLNGTPSVDAAHIGVAVNDGVISLSEEAGTYPEKRSAEQAALRVRGRTAVADKVRGRNTWSERSVAPTIAPRSTIASLSNISCRG